MFLVYIHKYSTHAYKGTFVRGVITMTYQTRTFGWALVIMKKTS